MKQKSDIIITSLEMTIFTIEDVHQLVDKAWRRWLDAGLDAVSFHLSPERFAQNMSKRKVFVAIDQESGELLGCHALKANRKKHSLSGSFLAVRPKAQWHGVATRLLEEEMAIAIKAGYTHMLSATAPTAYWSVRWHLKNGYRIIGYRRSPQYNHPLYIFRRQLQPSSSFFSRVSYYLYSSRLFCRLRYYATYVATCICKDNQGRLNIIGRFIDRMIKE